MNQFLKWVCIFLGILLISGCSLGDKNFMLYVQQQLSVKIVIPAGDEIWFGGSKHYIVWSVQGGLAPYTINLSYSPDGPNGPWLKIANNISGVSYLWKLPLVNTTKCYVCVNVIDALGNFAKNISNNFSIIIPSKKLSKIEIIPHVEVIYSGDKQQFSAIAYDLYERYVPGVVFEWTVEPKDIGNITVNGVFESATTTTIKKGWINASAIVCGALHIGTLKISVIPTKPNFSIKVIPPHIKVRYGNSVRVVCTAYTSDNKTLGGVLYEWELDNKNAGVIKVIDPASTNIMLTGYESCTLRVTGNYHDTKREFAVRIAVDLEIKYIKVVPNECKLIIGDKKQFIGVAYSHTGCEIDIKLDWHVTNGVGKIDSNGLFIAHTPGRGKVIAEKDNVRGFCVVTVLPGNDTTIPYIEHLPILEAYYKEINITANVVDNLGIENVSLWYKSEYDEKYNMKEMVKLDKNMYVCTLLIKTVTYYYIEAYDISGNVARVPGNENLSYIIKPVSYLQGQVIKLPNWVTIWVLFCITLFTVHVVRKRRPEKEPPTPILKR